MKMKKHWLVVKKVKVDDPRLTPIVRELAYKVGGIKPGRWDIEFDKVCNILSEYGTQQTYTPAAGAFMKEHYQVILKNHALQTLAEL